MNNLLPGVLNILAGSTPMPHHFERLADECGVPEGEVRIAFLTGLKQVLATDLPADAFADLRSRQSMLDALQTALDAAIEQEEASLDGASPMEEGD
jgi:type III secretion system TyeA family effector delivery regulator